MKKVLITGKGSYIGNKIDNWLMESSEAFEVDQLCLMDGSWKTHDFKCYDVVLHVAGIAHMKERKENKELYYKVNRDLAYDVALKAKSSGISHFIFLSSMSVYGMDRGVISQATVPKPNSYYGDSKLQAEERINGLIDPSFNVAIIRPPMVYGEGCRGNYTKLSKIALKLPLFPKVGNARSMVHIDNLCKFVKAVILQNGKGRFFPQNPEYVNTTELVKAIAACHSNKLWAVKGFDKLLGSISHPTLNKVFGTLIYSDDLLKNNDNIQMDYLTFEETIARTEGRKRVRSSLKKAAQ